MMTFGESSEVLTLISSDQIVYPERGSLPWGDDLDGFFGYNLTERYEKGGKPRKPMSVKVAKRYDAVMNRFASFLRVERSKTLRDFEHPDAMNWLEYLEVTLGKSRPVVVYHEAVLIQFCRWLALVNGRVDNPFSGHKRLRRSVAKCIGKAEIQKALSTDGNMEGKVVMLSTVNFGLLPRELRLLKRSHLTMTTGEIREMAHIKIPGRKSAVHKMWSELAFLVEDYLKTLDVRSEWLFPGIIPSEPASEWRIRKWLRSLSADSGIRLSFVALRNTFVVLQRYGSGSEESDPEGSDERGRTGCNQFPSQGWDKVAEKANLAPSRELKEMVKSSKQKVYSIPDQVDLDRWFVS